MRWRDLSFRWKLLTTLAGLVGAVTVAVLFITSRQVQESYERMFETSFARELDHTARTRDARLREVERSAAAMSRSVRWTAVFNELVGDPDSKAIAEDLYDHVRVALSEPQMQELEIARARFFRLLDANGKTIPPPDGTAGFTNSAASGALAPAIHQLRGAAHSGAERRIAYVTITDSATPKLFEILGSPIIDRASEETVGALVLGFEAELAEGNRTTGSSGWWHGETLFSKQIPAEAQPFISKLVAGSTSRTASGQAILAGEPHRVFVKNLTPNTSASQATWEVWVYSRAPEIESQAQLRQQILALGAIGLIAALGVGLALAHTLARPIQSLERATAAVQSGDLQTRVPVAGRDELGRLAESFNSMTAGLELKEKYRSVLDIVADKDIAEELMSGKLGLGGEVKEIAVLFCDIRGFTALTEQMPPAEVIQMLNEHFTPLTCVVYEHRGVVDKFVGDLIMGVFGAPKSYGDHVRDAVECARSMIRERAKLNATSKYKIEIGIGVASGKAVAGRMGSENRLSYTVIGERVNLASRLCSQAGRMEVIIDEHTHAKLAGALPTEALPAVKLKGFAEPVRIFSVRAEG